MSKWIVAGTDTSRPYPCRCHERKGPRCSAAWCPCAGREDPPGPACCGNWFTPADHVQAMAEWRIWKLEQGR